MTETQQSICSWADTTFGPPASDASIAARALVEMAELVTACVNGEPAEVIGVEIADVVIVLARLGRSIDVDLVDIAAKYSAWRVNAPPLSYAARAAEDLTSALRIIGSDGDSSLELIDMTEGLALLACRCSTDLSAAIDAKMAVNRARRWTLDGFGHGRHVKQ